MSSLDEARREINDVDKQMAELFTRRMIAAETIVSYKAEHGLPILDKAREEQVVERNAAFIPDETIRNYYVRFIKDTMAVSRSYQEQLLKGMRVAYSGVEGAFAHIAAKQVYPTGQAISYRSFEDAYHAVENGECHCAVLPIENSFAGEVGQVIDLLFSGSLHISNVYDLSIRHQLMALPQATMESVTNVYSHPQALQQCADFIRRHNLEPVSCVNTAVAAKQVADSDDVSIAAIASKKTAELYGLKILQTNINESAWNTTRFAVLTPADNRPSNTVGMRTMLFFSVSHQSGSLAGAISIIGKHGFNMLSLRSRAQKDLLWQYYFAVEMEGNVYTSDGAAMIDELSGCCDKLKVVGVYPDDVNINAFEEDSL